MQNKQTFNTSKYKIITFTRPRSPIIITYEHAGDSLDRVNDERDLKLTVDSKLSFHEHVKQV